MKAIPCVYCTMYNCFFTMWFCVDFTLSIPFSEHDVSYLSVSRKKQTNYWKFQASDCLLLSLKGEGFRVPFVVSWYKFLNSVILKTLNEIVLNFLSGESKTNVLYVNINFTGNVHLGFSRYCDKVLQEPAVFHLFWVPALTNNVFSIFFSHWPVVNNYRNKQVSAFLFYFIGFETNDFLYIFHKMSYFESNLFF